MTPEREAAIRTLVTQVAPDGYVVPSGDVAALVAALNAERRRALALQRKVEAAEALLRKALAEIVECQERLDYLVEFERSEAVSNRIAAHFAGDPS